jgi:hypothetical protein
VQNLSLHKDHEGVAVDTQPPPDQADDPRLPPLIDYLNQHKDRINIEALRKQLLDSGHEAALVDAAYQRVTGQAPGNTKPLAWPFGLLIAMLNLGLTVPLAFFLADLQTSVFPALNNNLLWLPLPIMLIALPPIIQLLVGRRLSGGSRDRLGRALVWGGIFSLIVIGSLLLLFGACVVIIIGLYGMNM